MNSEKSTIFNAYKIRHDLTDEIDLVRDGNRVAISNLSIYYTWKNIKKSYRKINLKYLKKHEMKSLN